MQIDDDDENLETVRIYFTTPQPWSKCLELETVIDGLLEDQEVGELVGIGTEQSTSEPDFNRALDQLNAAARQGNPVLDLSFETDDVDAILALLQQQLSSVPVPAGSRVCLQTEDGKYETRFSVP